MTLLDFALRNVGRDLRKYLYYYVNCTFAVMIFFLFSVLSNHPDMDAVGLQSACGLVLLGGKMIISMFALFFIGYSANGYLKTRARQFGLLVIIGASRKQLNRLIFLENMIVGTLAILTGILLGMLLAKGFLGLASFAVGGISFRYYFPTAAIVTTFLTLGILFFFVSWFIPKLVRKERVIKLLKVEEEPERQQNLKPYLLWLGVTIPAWVLIYTDRIPHAKALQESSLISGLILVTYVVGLFLVSALGMRLVIWVFKRTSLYWRRIHLISISNLQASLRSCSHVMTTSALFFSLAFFGVVVMVSNVRNVARGTRLIFPSAFSYMAYDPGVPVADHVAEIERELCRYEGFEKLRLAYGHPREKSWRWVLLPVSRYNTCRQFFRMPTVQVGDGHAIGVAVHAGTPPVKVPAQMDAFFREHGRPLAFAGASEALIAPDGLFDGICVVSDATFDALAPFLETKDFHSFRVDNFLETSRSDVKLRSVLNPYSKNQKIGFFSQISQYQGSCVETRFILYIGSIICIAFILAVSSFVYSKLYSNLDQECARYRRIVKMGLSRRELAKVLDTTLAVLMVTPFGVAMACMWASVIFLERYVLLSNLLVATVCSLAFLAFQILGVALVRRGYHRAVFRTICPGAEVPAPDC